MDAWMIKDMHLSVYLSYVFMDIYVSIYACVYICMCVYMRVCVYVFMYVGMHVCKRVPIYSSRSRLSTCLPTAAGRKHRADPERRQHSNLWRTCIHGFWLIGIHELLVLRPGGPLAHRYPRDSGR